MGYYDAVLIIFKNGEYGPLDYRAAGQMLPAGAIPQAIINIPRNEYVEIINSLDLEEVIDFAEGLEGPGEELKETILKIIPSTC